MASSPQFAELDLLTAHEVEALRDLYCACEDLRHELKSADALMRRAYQMGSNAERYTEGQVFTRHVDALGDLEEAAVNFSNIVENLAWQHVSACVVLATAVLERLARQAPGLSADELGRLGTEPTVGELCAALSIPGARLLPARQGKPVEWFDQDRQKMLISAESLERRTGGLEGRLSEADTGAFGDMDPWFAWVDQLVAEEIGFHGDGEAVLGSGRR